MYGRTGEDDKLFVNECLEDLPDVFLIGKVSLANRMAELTQPRRRIVLAGMMDNIDWTENKYSYTGIMTGLHYEKT